MIQLFNIENKPTCDPFYTLQSRVCVTIILVMMDTSISVEHKLSTFRSVDP